MSLNYKTIKGWQFADVAHEYTEKDTILYALSLGLGNAPLDRQQLRFVYEKQLQVFPTMPVVLGHPGFWLSDPKAGVTWVKVVHGEQRLTLHNPVPGAGKVIGRSRVSRVVDKGADKGALIVVESRLYGTPGDTLLATSEKTIFCRADGGFGESDRAAEPLPPVPPDNPETAWTLSVPTQAALLYRLNADRNPLHADPDVASQAGYRQPILHGLYTYGLAAHAVLRSYCGYDPQRLAYIHARFSAAVFPGETLRCEMWRTGPETVQFQVKALERNIVAISHGISGIKTP
ncbi:MaoC/PaaZ C-terminal domain-containing protein [Candidimonas nitroreducens]|uniref:3-alpha,7-alpha, 12-alpha-trihydroxy-5-beta-cholest-24-enoyl-CoA hydratase n=1 Tax=Candidimonas nitroreducens TaxID=683354 RepID=A0A225MAS5_9BURK|nr:MaoC/PaaZ C-terminal domain-containing protein [Candidimonas nitroreducens]OWT58316.1 3-alpha,7-alpha,12-alpha-trihydroxy-5-beta-cholest-24-enoyl-CoA hydratase [Candidimonas nitroreducens]